jgi:hypothetical protein
MTSEATNPCSESPPPGAAPEVVGYLRAVDTADVGWAEVTKLLVADNGAGGKDYLAILNLQIKTDEAFVDQLQAVSFTSAAVGPARAYAGAVSRYVAVLKAILPTGGLATYEQRGVLDTTTTQRQEFGATLRQTLGLPPPPCTFLKP